MIDQKDLGHASEIVELKRELEKYGPEWVSPREILLEAEVERLRMQLAACGVAALSNTEESMAKQLIGRDNPYWSASYEDVVNAVKREIALWNKLDDVINAVKRDIAVRKELGKVENGAV